MEPKTMVQASNEVGRTVEPTEGTDTPVVPGDYHEFKGSNAKQMETYSKRVGKLSEVLGNKDSVKG